MARDTVAAASHDPAVVSPRSEKCIALTFKPVSQTNVGMPTASSAKPRSSMPGDPRSRILAAAEEAFASQGFHGASLNSIARAAGLSNPGLIHHFPTKAALYLAVLRWIGDEVTDQMTAALDGRSDPGDRLRAMIRTQVEWTFRRPAAVRLVVRELVDNVGRVETADSLPLAGFVETLRGEIRQAQAHGLASRGAPMTLVVQMLGTLSYGLVARPTFLRMGLGGPAMADDRAWAEEMSETLLRALMPATPAR